MIGFLRVATAFGALLLLNACTPDGKPAVSLQQARQITADFQGQSFRAPPRTISDIAAILDQQQPGWRCAVCGPQRDLPVRTGRRRGDGKHHLQLAATSDPGHRGHRRLPAAPAARTPPTTASALLLALRHAHQAPDPGACLQAGAKTPSAPQLA